MIQLKTYQEEAVSALVKDAFTLLKKPGSQHRMVFKAPTGAGKTVSMAAFLNKLAEELPDRTDVPSNKVAYIWFAPNQLHLQSYLSLKHYFEELRSLKPIQFEDVTDGKLHPNEVLFLNWQSVNKANNKYIREDEQGKNLLAYINNARLEDTKIVCILDEAHYHANGKKAKDLLAKIYSKVEIDVSATPLFHSDYGHTIKRDEAVEAEMIKKNVVLNPALDHHQQQGHSLNQVLLEQALEKRNDLHKAYQKLNVDINPLLLIQLPNETKNESVYDLEIIEEVKAFLDFKGISIQNEKLAVWLSKEKSNLEGIEKKKSLTEVLLFKQAIALGWDCPRAAVLLIFREINQEHFGIQTVGRILRMPEQKHYPSPVLNNGYVYTNLSKDLVRIVQEDMDYIVQNKAERIAAYKNVELASYYINRGLTRNRLGSKFRKCLYEVAEATLGITTDVDQLVDVGLYHYNTTQMTQHFIEMSVDEIEIPIPKDLSLIIEEGTTYVEQKERFAKTTNELNVLFRQFCRDNVGGYAKVDSTPVLEMGLKMLFEEYFALDEFHTIKIILHGQNRTQFVGLIDSALESYQRLLAEKAAKKSQSVEKSVWEVPEEKIYNENYNERPAEIPALVPFYEQVNASSPEKEFTRFLESNKEHIEWWYKNGDMNKEDFAVTYINHNGETKGFYVDFVIKLKSGKIALFDTKTLDSDIDFVLKHNALFEYIEENNKKNKSLLGGVIVPKTSGADIIWKYAGNLIDSAKDSTGWLFFNPSNC